MKRLTKRMGGLDYLMCGNVIMAKCENCNNKLLSCYERDCLTQIEVINRLAAYEDTNLTPAEVAELVQAKADGRVVVLPCKIGDTVYVIRSDRVIEFVVKQIDIDEYDTTLMGGEIWEYTRTRYIGKNTFFTRHEAQKALKESEK